MREKIERLLIAAESGMLSSFIPPSDQQERDLVPITIAVLAWCNGDEKALRPWPNIARFFEVRSEEAQPMPTPTLNAV